LTENTRYQSTFEGWILPTGQIVKGPFTVEVFHDGYKGLQKALWRARLLPTMQRMGGNKGFKEAKDCCTTIAGTFQRQTQNWKAVK
jgi:hypothetical protein